MESESSKLREHISHIAHEFKTPLNAVNGFTQLMMEMEYPRDRQIQFLQNIKSACNHMHEIIKYSLETAKSQNPDFRFELTEFSPAKVTEEIFCVLNQKITEKNLTLNINLEKGFIVCDKLRFRQVVYNLAGNAYKFNKKGGHIEVKSYFEGENYFFEIKDTGIGISEEHKKHIFELFCPTDNTTPENKDGSGIGLYTCKKIIESLGGDISFESIVSKGSVFRFFIPVNAKRAVSNSKDYSFTNES